MSSILNLSPPAVMRWGWLNWPASARRSVTLGFLILINWLLLAPAGTFREVHIFLSHQDKIVHFGMFGLLTGLARWSIPAPWGQGWKRPVFILSLVSYGLATECLQLLMPSLGRNFEWSDLACDAIGIAFGLWLCERLARRDPPC
jgi:VanZ family protein